MLVLDDAPAQVRTSFSFKAALLESIIWELEDATLDTGPIKLPTTPILYYETPLLSGAHPPPLPATPTAPYDTEAELEKDPEAGSKPGIGTEFAKKVDVESRMDWGVEFEDGVGFEFEKDPGAESEKGANTKLTSEAGTNLGSSADSNLKKVAADEAIDNASAELEYLIFGGDSPLSSPPSSRPPSPSLPPPAHPPLPAKNSRQRRNKEKSRAKRTNKRQEERAQDINASRMPKDRAREKYIDAAKKVASEYDAKDFPCASTAYVATQEKAGGVSSLQQLLDKGFELLEWDGRSSRPIVDSSGRVIAALVGQPNDPSWKATHEDAFEFLRECAPQCNFTYKCTHHRRGNFAALNTGISFGGGPKKPGNLTHSKPRLAVLRRLVERPSFIRLAGFASSAFSSWMPRLHKHYETCLDTLTKHDSGLTPNFKNSVWAAVAFNFGPRTVTGKHRDAANLPFGICSVTALGKFDHTRGGHIVLWELKLVIEFPAGSTILIPSGAIAHSNTPVGPGELRCSFTQYSAGGLFRWVDQGFQKTTKYKKTLSEEERNQLPELDEARCAFGMSLFSTLDELRTPKKKQAAHVTPLDAASS